MWATAVLTALALFVLVAFHVLAVQHAFALDRLTEQRKTEELRYERLRAEVATLSAPESVVDGRASSSAWCRRRPSTTSMRPPRLPHATAPDRTTSTLGDTHGEAKKSLGP